MSESKQKPYPWLVPAIFTGAAFPVLALLFRAKARALGANPIELVLNQLGYAALILLTLTLACTPLKIVFGWIWPIRIRKTLGLWAFFYALLHVAAYAGFDQALNWGAIWEDVIERKFIFVGFTAFLILIPLALTSTSGMLKRLGFRNWQRLHRLSYLAALCAVVHFYWRVKKDITEPVIFGIVLAVLLSLRLFQKRKASKATR